MTFNISTNPMTVASWDTINSQQAYRYKPVAVTNLNDIHNLKHPTEKSSKLKTTAKIVGTLAVIAGALALGRAKIKALKDVNVHDAAAYKGTDKLKYYTAKAGQWVIDKANGIKKIFIKTDAPAPKS